MIRPFIRASVPQLGPKLSGTTARTHEYSDVGKTFVEVSHEKILAVLGAHGFRTEKVGEAIDFYVMQDSLSVVRVLLSNYGRNKGFDWTRILVGAKGLCQNKKFYPTGQPANIFCTAPKDPVAEREDYVLGKILVSFDTAAREAQNLKTALCPECFSPMRVIGTTVGNMTPMMGCFAYPECRFTCEVPE